jgi:hypothetical protein
MRSHGIGCEACGRGFANETALFSHQRKHCKQAKRSIREVLTDARAYWSERVTKRIRRDPTPGGVETEDLGPHASVAMDVEVIMSVDLHRHGANLFNRSPMAQRRVFDPTHTHPKGKEVIKCRIRVHNNLYQDLSHGIRSLRRIKRQQATQKSRMIGHLRSFKAVSNVHMYLFLTLTL